MASAAQRCSGCGYYKWLLGQMAGAGSRRLWKIRTDWRAREGWPLRHCNAGTEQPAEPVAREQQQWCCRQRGGYTVSTCAPFLIVWGARLLTCVWPEEDALRCGVPWPTFVVPQGRASSPASPGLQAAGPQAACGLFLVTTDKWLMRKGKGG